jgi:holo-[acyl-carrier protein] synthase
LPPPPADPAVGVGIDLVEVDRVSRLLAEQPGIAPTIFTPRELDYCGSGPSSARRLAARFAAKEAVLKALGSGLQAGIELAEVEILRSPRGRPSVRLSGRARDLAEGQGLASLEVSMSHAGGIAVAQAVSIRVGQPVRNQGP